MTREDQKMTPNARMAAGYLAADDQRAREQTAQLAAEFRPDPRLERLIRLRQTDPKGFARFGPETTIALGYYESRRTAAGYEGASDDDAA